MDFDVSKLGATRVSEEFRVNSARLAQFAAAINDANPAHLDGSLAPPVFANVPPMQVMVEVMRAVSPLFGLHGQHDMRFHRAIRPGMRLWSSATVDGVHDTPAGAAIVIGMVTRTQDDELVNEQSCTVLAAGAHVARSVGRKAAEHRLPVAIAAQPPLATATYAMDPDQTHRYAEAARDYSDYTLDLDAARAKGFDGILVHGMLSFAFAGRAIVEHACVGDSTRLKRLAARFSAPLYLVPGQALTTRLWALDSSEGNLRFGFESTDAAGRIVIRHGLAEVAR